MSHRLKEGDKIWIEAHFVHDGPPGFTCVKISDFGIYVHARKVRPRFKRDNPDNDWLPFRTAPTDGTEILATWAPSGPAGREVLLVRWEGCKWVCGGGSPLRAEPTHWIPIPAFGNGETR